MKPKNILSKIKLLLRLLFFVKKTFSLPEEKKIVLFDCESPEQLGNLLPKKKMFILTTRTIKIKELYINFDLIKFMLLNFYKQSFKINYLIFLIKKINPKVVITWIDNSTEFYLISKELKKQIKFIAIQQASRETEWLPIKWTKKIHIPEYYCFGDFDKKIYLKKTQVEKIQSKGSLKAACALTYIKKNKIKIKNDFDICLVSEINPPDRKYVYDKKNKWKRNQTIVRDLDHVPNFNYSSSKIAKYVYKFADKYNLKVAIAGKGEKNSEDRKKEFKFYENAVGRKNLNLRPRNEKTFSNYQLMLKSKIVIGMRSTMAREAIGYNLKTFFCNFTDHANGDYPFCKKMKNLYLVHPNNHSYDLFEKKLYYILKLSNKKYFELLGNIKNEIIMNSKGYDNFILKRVNKIINS